ncbi:unnamed protein product [Caenorhabditis nigoni]
MNYSISMNGNRNGGYAASQNHHQHRNDPRTTPTFSQRHLNCPTFVPRQRTEEHNNREPIEILVREEKELFEKMLVVETKTHPFTPYYPDIRKSSEEYNLALNIKALLDNYTHHKALRFIAKTHVWNLRPPPFAQLPFAPYGMNAVRQFIKMDGDHAIYRVIADKGDKYILLACHLNVHAFHRGDLRFLEVNSRTRTNASEYSCIGYLALGDLVAVSELAKQPWIPREMGCWKTSDMNQESPCVWMVVRMTVLMRQRFDNVPFVFLNNGAAVALKWREPLTVKAGYNGNLENRGIFVFVGSGFIAMQVPELASGHSKMQETQLLGLSKEITRYPWSTGTIFHYEFSPYFTNQMHIGHCAYSVANPDPNGVVEFCALMGASASYAVLTGNFDCRSFAMINPQKLEEVVTFKIENISEPKPESLWKQNTRISIGSSRRDAHAVIENVIPLGDMLYISARLSREFAFEFTDEVHMVSQREMPDGKGLVEGFVDKMEHGSNGARILTALYGGPCLPQEQHLFGVHYEFPGANPIRLNVDQNEYVNSIIRKVPITIANSPFGCGKSMTIATAAYYSVLRYRTVERDLHQQLLVTQSNYASVNLVDITNRFSDLCTVVRYVSLSSWMELPDESRTELDFPVQMQKYFIPYVTGEKEINDTMLMIEMAKYLKEYQVLKVEEMDPVCQHFFSNCPVVERLDLERLSEFFFESFNPEIVITTADSLQSVIPFLSKGIDTVQFDEASQMPESALIQVISNFPNADFGLVGDIQQLPPYCDTLLTTNLKRFGIGNTLERAIKNRLFPQYVLRNVYRCHPFITAMLGDLFYGGRLVTNVKPNERDEFMRSRPDFWPNHECPIMVRHNGTPSTRYHTSMFNDVEILMVSSIIDQIFSHPNCTIQPKDIGIISFYKAQTTRLLETIKNKDIKIGTVDSFQGMERQVMILCCTNEMISGFLANPNRINVSMSRAKQATIIIGNVNSLRNAQYWRRFVMEADRYGCLL